MQHPVRSLLALVVVACGTTVEARTPDDIAGRMVGEIEGQAVELPMLTSDYDISIQGDMASITLTQEFINPHSAPMRAEYLFPLNKGAAVYAMEMVVGNERVKAVVQETAEAEKTFEKAEREGKAAALLTQHRPNMFTQKIANLMPGLPVTVTLKYVQTVPEIDGAHELVVPLIVGPRYVSPGRVAGTPPLANAEDLHTTDATAPAGGWQIAPPPAYSPVAGLDLPDEISEDRVSVDVSIDGGGLPVEAVSSATHGLDLTHGEGATLAALSAGRTLDNRDFVLRYRLGGGEVSTGVLTHFDDRGGFASLLIAPPTVPEETEATARELVFVLDTSGSMTGDPMAASKRFMEAALSHLRRRDYFRIIRFSNDATHFAEKAIEASPDNVRAGLAFVRSLSAGGGTEIDHAIRTAFSTDEPDNTLRIVVFLSDGYIGDEARVLQTIDRLIGDARIYAFGVGTAVNRFLLDGMAETGRGYARYIDPTTPYEDAAEALAMDLKTPLLTDIEIDWGDLEVTDAVPSRIPDLFAGNSVRVLARFEEGGPREITVKGRVRGRPAELPVTLDLPSHPMANPESTEAIALVWARRKIADLERDFALRTGDPVEVQRQITGLGLGFSLQTRHTSFVAVSEQVVNETGLPGEARPIPLPRVAGVTKAAYPTGFAGGSTPAPAAWMGFIVISLMGCLYFARWRSA